MKAAIKAISYYLPPDILTNDILNREFPEWAVEKISEKTGVYNRHIAGIDICSSDLAVESSKKLFIEHNIDPAIIDFVLFCTQSPDYYLPSTACILQKKLDIPQTAGALDFNLGCSGFIYGLSLARGLIETGEAKNVLLITAETYSKFIHPNDRSSRTVFGDGSASTLISASDSGSIGPFVFGTDGTGANNLIVKTGGQRNPERKTDSPDIVDEFGNVTNDNCLYMNGTEIFYFTTRVVPNMVNELHRKTNLNTDNIDIYVLHQANAYLLEAIRKKINIPKDKFYIFMKDCGNTVSATIPIALSDAITRGKISKGNKALLAGFGVGYSWAGCIIEL